MILLTTMLATSIITSTNFSDYKNYTDHKLCDERNIFNKKPKTFPFTKLSCYWSMYSELIYSEYVHLNKPEKRPSCRVFLKEQCGLETNDIVLWVSKQEKQTIKCIKNYYQKQKKIYDEENCRNTIELSNIHLAQYDLPFCSMHYAYFASNFPFYLNDSMLSDARNT